MSMDGGYAFFIFRALKLGGMEMGFLFAPGLWAKKGIRSKTQAGKERDEITRANPDEIN